MTEHMYRDTASLIVDEYDMSPAKSKENKSITSIDTMIFVSVRYFVKTVSVGLAMSFMS